MAEVNKLDEESKRELDQKVEEKDLDIKIVTQYIKDLSIENPNPAIYFSKEDKKDVKINYSVNTSVGKEDFHELSFVFDMQIKNSDDKMIYILEINYVGVFSIKAEKNILERILLTKCAELLFPFVRKVISDNTASSGIKPIMLDPINFYKVYEEGKNRKQDSE